MGVTGFYNWLQKTKGYKPTKVIVQKDDKLLVDFRLLINKIAYAIPSDCQNLPDEIAKQIKIYFNGYTHVVFVNDGDDEISPLKFPTLAKRRQAKQKIALKVESKKEELEIFVKKRKLNQENDELEFEKDVLENILKNDLEKSKRQARKITTSLAMEVIVYLKDTFTIIQALGEADVLLSGMAKEFKFLISEDSDAILSGCNNLLRHFGTQNLLYNDVLSFLNLTQKQLIEIVAFSGCDYSKIIGIGLQKAEGYIRKYGCAENFLKSEEAKKYEIAEDFQDTIDEIIVLFTPTPIKFDLFEDNLLTIL